MKQRIKLLAASLANIVPGVGEIHMLTRSGAYAPYSYWTDLVDSDRDHTSLATAEAAMTTDRNDVLLISPDNHTQTAAITWDLNCSHMVGMGPKMMMNHRSRIGHSANVTPLLTVSGYGNSFHNLYFMYGRGAAANLSCLTVSGERNAFHNCHFLCGNATEADTANFDLVNINCNEIYFNNCYFGNDTIAWGAVDLIRLYGAADRSCRAVFDNCIFVMNQDAGADGNFIETVAGQGEGVTIFRNCNFINTGTAMTLAIDGVGLSSGVLFFDKLCAFYNVTDIVAAAYESYVISGFNYAADDDAQNLHAGLYDHTT